MSEPLVPTNPIVVNKTYNKLWIQRLTVLADSPAREAMAKIRLVPYVKETGELAPSTLGFEVIIPDVFARMQAGDMELAQIFNGILDYASKEAAAQGKL